MRNNFDYEEPIPTIKLENEVSNLELSKRLKELNVKQESYFTWSKAMDRNAWRIENTQFFAVDRRRDISAFTVAELGEMLPIDTCSWRNIASRYVCKWTQGQHQEYEQTEFADTEANARAKMLIYLLENKLITL